jgi:hypothetical protein
MTKMEHLDPACLFSRGDGQFEIAIINVHQLTIPLAKLYDSFKDQVNPAVYSRFRGTARKVGGMR